MTDIHIHDWMIHDLGLTGCELLVYATIYRAENSILLTDEERCQATFAQTLAETVGYTERNVRMALAKLLARGLIAQRAIVAGGRRHTCYQTVLPTSQGVQ